MSSLTCDTVPTPGGTIEIKLLESGNHLVSFTPCDSDDAGPVTEFESTFPLALLSLLARKSGAWVCEELARHERPDYVAGVLKRQVPAFADPAGMAGKRLLDFGCGTGASTLALGRMLPQTEIVGVELDPVLVNRARLIASYVGGSNVRFLASPSGTELPAGIGAFDYLMMSAVWEHLLPEERPAITARLWNLLVPGGVWFLNQTPYRWSPYEHHTTGLWFVNYLPDRLALAVARRWSTETPEANADCGWSELLRKGIRGGTEAEVLGLIGAAGGQGAVLQPRAPYRDRADYWLRATSPRHRGLKQAIAAGFRLTDRFLGTVPSSHLEIAIQKRV